jgi:hypothetical protein
MFSFISRHTRSATSPIPMSSRGRDFGTVRCRRSTRKKDRLSFLRVIEVPCHPRSASLISQGTVARRARRKDARRDLSTLRLSRRDCNRPGRPLTYFETSPYSRDASKITPCAFHDSSRQYSTYAHMVICRRAAVVRMRLASCAEQRISTRALGPGGRRIGYGPSRPIRARCFSSNSTALITIFST